MQILVIIAVYTILYIYSISQINHWLKTISKRLLPRFIADTILIVLGLMPVGAAFIGKGSLRNALETNGNLWFGYLVYLTGPRSPGIENIALMSMPPVISPTAAAVMLRL